MSVSVPVPADWYPAKFLALSKRTDLERASPGGKQQRNYEE